MEDEVSVCISLSPICKHRFHRLQALKLELYIIHIHCTHSMNEKLNSNNNYNKNILAAWLATKQSVKI